MTYLSFWFLLLSTQRGREPAVGDSGQVRAQVHRVPAPEVHRRVRDLQSVPFAQHVHDERLGVAAVLHAVRRVRRGQERGRHSRGLPRPNPRGPKSDPERHLRCGHHGEISRGLFPAFALARATFSVLKRKEVLRRPKADDMVAFLFLCLCLLVNA